MSAIQQVLAALGGAAAPGQQVFTSSGTFTVPAGVTSICAVAVGRGQNGVDNVVLVVVLLQELLDPVTDEVSKLLVFFRPLRQLGRSLARQKFHDFWNNLVKWQGPVFVQKDPDNPVSVTAQSVWVV